ncbi:MAG TPA: hypothetical protein P5525_07505 [Candidatus Paceibacterota bacterium]|nr:hypothetical protein [Candidatus Paceibacterota bacterium]
MKNNDALTLEQHQACAVAFLLAERKLGQANVAELLRLSQATISRRVILAKKMGVLEESIRFIAPRPELAEQLRERWAQPFTAYERQIKERYGTALRQVRVFPSRATIESRDDWDHAVVTFGEAAARHVLELVRRSRIVGISYGRTQKAIVSGLLGLLKQIPTDRPKKAKFIPLWGSLHGSPRQDVPDPHLGEVFTKPEEISPDFMAKELNEVLAGGPQHYCLEAVPSFLPPGFFKADRAMAPVQGTELDPSDQSRRKAILDLFQHPKMSEHKRIFGDRPKRGEIYKASAMFVTAASPTDFSIGRFYHARLMDWFDLGERQMREHFLGDLGLVLLGKGTKGERLAARLDHLSLCLQRKHLADCAERARKTGHPGVVAFAVGKARALMLHECIQQRLVNEAVIDPHCAAALCHL